MKKAPPAVCVDSGRGAYIKELLLSGKLQNSNIPKQANFDDFTDKKMASRQKKINSRPRQKLKFETLKAEFFKRIA